MRKFSALYKNELIKTLRKPIFIVLIALVVASMIIVACFMGFLRNIGDFVNYDTTDSAGVTLSRLEEEVEGYRKDLEKTLSEYEPVLKEAYDPVTKTFDDTISEAKSKVAYKMNETLPMINDDTIEIARLRLEEKTGRKYFYYYRENNAFNYLFSDMMSSLMYSDGNELFIKTYDEIMEKYPTCKILDEQLSLTGWLYKPDAVLPKDVHDKYLDLCTKGDAATLFESKREEVRASQASDTEKKIRIESIDIIEEIFDADMSASAWNEIETNIEQLNMYKLMLATGKDYSGRKVSEDRLKDASFAVTEIEASLRAGAPGFGGKYTQEDRFLGTILIEIGVAVSQILVIIIGAVIVASDFQTGAIKTLIIAPVKRRKIVSAKFCMLVTVWLACMVLVFLSYLVAAPISGSDFGNNVFVLGGSIITLNPFLYYLLYIFISFIPVLFHGCFAFMLSTLVRNTGGSISISMATVFVINSNAATIITLISTSGSYFFRHLMKFLPSSNLNLAKLFFSSYVSNGSLDITDILMASIFSADGVNGPLFAFLYLALLSALFVYISYQSYIKRDIK